MSHVVDLPEPKRIEVTPEHRIMRQWDLVIAFLWLSALYATLHKCLVPIVLSFTRLANSPYATWNPWFFHPLLMVILAGRDKKLTLATSLLAGAGIFHGIVETALVAGGKVTGWHAFSHLLAAIPFAAVCVALLSGPFKGKDFRAAWAGALLVAMLSLGEVLWTVP